MAAQDDLYRQAAAEHGAALERLARAYEFGAEDRRDLLQEIHLALWRSFNVFNGQCSMRTWIYRVAHNAAASHVLRSRRRNAKSLVSLEEIAESGETGALSTPATAEHAVEQAGILNRLYALIRQLNPIDRQMILLYLEGEDAASIGEVTGASPGCVATKIHRIKKLLADRFRNGGNDDSR